MESRLDLRYLFPLAMLAFLAHSDTLELWFVATDTLPLIETSRVTESAGIVDLFTRPLMAGSDFVTRALFYRPVASVTYAIDHALWGLSPFGYHLTNLVLHVVATVLAVIAIADVTGRPLAGYLTGLLFTVHPVTVEVVPVIARRQDVLLTVFVLGTVSLFVRWHRRWRRHRAENRGWTLRPYRPLVAALAGYALALGSKETALMVPVLVGVWAVLHGSHDRARERLGNAFAAVGPFAALTLLYIGIRVAVLGGLGGYSPSTPFAELPGYTLENVLSTAGKYALWAVLPVRFGGVGALVPAPHVVVAVLAGVIVLGGVGFVALTSREPLVTPMRRRLIFFGCWFVGPFVGLLLARQILLQPQSFGFGIRNAYGVLVPVLAGFVTLLLESLDRIRTRIERSHATVDLGRSLVVAVVSVVLVTTVAVSPVFSPDDGWEAAGELNQRSLEGVDDSLEGAPNATTVYLVDFPNRFDARNATPRSARSVTPLLSYSVEAWLALHGSSPQVQLIRPRTVETLPDRLSFATRVRGDVVVLRVDDDARSLDRGTDSGRKPPELKPWDSGSVVLS
ncbi:hypothetical protein [Halococcus agarilyticus]|uniref:hypothetical protein n=1 Tax=Halococcus agarilyticus TaxID=1232219 RepID=UPI000AE3D9BD|nr:hypothetical protein [Halococcus agarilyticus]